MFDGIYNVRRLTVWWKEISSITFNYSFS